MSYVVKGMPFRYKGSINIEDCETSEEAMQTAGLDWEVEKCPLYGKMPGMQQDKEKDNGFLYGGDYFDLCPNAYGIYRTDCNVMLGVVKDRYIPVQNVEAFNFFDDAIGKDKALWQTAGWFGNGEKVFASAKLPDTILVNGSDPVENYLVFMTSHDGSMGVKALLTPVRITCENTLNAAIRDSTNYVSFRHTASVHDNMTTASEILGICQRKIISITDSYNELYKKKITDSIAKETFASIVLTDKELFNIESTGHTIDEIFNRYRPAMEDASISTKKVNVLAAMHDYYFTGPGQASIVGTGWGAYNAITGYYSNVDNSVGTKRMDSLLYGDKSRKIELAGNLLLAS